MVNISDVLREYSPQFIEIFEKFLSDHGQQSLEGQDESNYSESIWDKSAPINCRPIKFTRESEVHLTDVEGIVESFIIDLYGVHYLVDMRQFWAFNFPRMRIYEYVMQILRYAEEDYLKNNSFINGIFTEIRNLVSNSSETIQPILIMENDGNNVNISRSFDLSMIGKSISETKACYEKLTEMLRQIAGLLRIPHVTDGVPLRFMVSYMYGLLCDRLNVLEHFEEFFNVITIELAKVNGKLLRLKQNNYNVDDSRWESVSSEGDPTVNHQP